MTARCPLCDGKGHVPPFMRLGFWFVCVSPFLVALLLKADAAFGQATPTPVPPVVIRVYQPEPPPVDYLAFMKAGFSSPYFLAPRSQWTPIPGATPGPQWDVVVPDQPGSGIRARACNANPNCSDFSNVYPGTWTPTPLPTLTPTAPATLSPTLTPTAPPTFTATVPPTPTATTGRAQAPVLQ